MPGFSIQQAARLEMNQSFGQQSFPHATLPQKAAMDSERSATIL